MKNIKIDEFIKGIAEGVLCLFTFPLVFFGVLLGLFLGSFQHAFSVGKQIAYKIWPNEKLHECF